MNWRPVCACMTLLATASCTPRVDQFQHSAGKGDAARVSAMLRKGSDINAVDPEGWTALHRASAAGHDEVVQLLIGRGASLSLQTPAGEQALHLAVRGGHDATVRALLAGGADVHARTAKGLTAYQQAAGYPEIVETLLAHGAAKE